MSNQTKSQHKNILLAIAGFVAVIIIVALIGFLALGREPDVKQGQVAAKPANPTPACDAYTFAGWHTAELATLNTEKPSYVTDFTATKNQDYYAVFSKTEESSTGGTKDITLDPTTDKTFPKDGITLSVSDGTLTNGTDYRVYKGHTMTITSSVGDMSNIVLTYVNSYNGGGWANSYQPNAATWTSPKTTSGDKGKQARISLIKITVGSGPSSTTYYTTQPYCVVCTAAVTVTKGDAVNGAFSIDKVGEQSTCDDKVVVTLSDIEPTNGYRFKEITQTGIESAIIDQDARTITYDKETDGASTINVVFEAIPQYTIAFFDNGMQIGEDQVVYEGKLPEVPDVPTPACDTYTFAGWWTAELAEDNTEAKVWISDFTATKDQNYYAVFSKTDENTTYYTSEIRCLATGIEEVGSESTNAVRSEKIVKDGQLYIRYNNNMYTTTGIRVQ